jgi:hypothetical protein
LPARTISLPIRNQRACRSGASRAGSLAAHQAAKRTWLPGTT